MPGDPAADLGGVAMAAFVQPAILVAACGGGAWAVNLDSATGPAINLHAHAQDKVTS
jgi:hypothetical protein